MEPIWRKASTIELYAAQHRILIESRGMGGFAEYDLPGYVLHGDILTATLQILGQIAQTWSNPFADRAKMQAPQDFELKIERALSDQNQWIGNGSIITDLEAWIETATLLHIRITYTPTDNTEDSAPWHTEHTYCGPFAIEWYQEQASV